MGLNVSTRTGQTFRRAGLVFGGTPTFLPEEKLKERLDSPSYAGKPTVREVLKAEQMLICEEVDDPKPAKGPKAAEETKAPKGD